MSSDGDGGRPSVFVGLHEDTNACAAAVDGEGRVLGAVAEERLSRGKYQGGYPGRSVVWLRDSGALAGRPASSSSVNPPPLSAAAARAEADAALSEASLRVVAANPYHPLPRLLDEGPPAGARDFRDPLQIAHQAWHGLIHRSSRVRERLAAFNKERLEERFRRPVDFVGHHVAHGASAYYTAPWPEATVVTCDNLGDGECAHAFHGRDGQLESLWAVSAWHSPGQFYGEIASALGIEPMTAGKVTGLAARGRPDAALAVLRQRLRLAPDRRGFRGPDRRHRLRGSDHWHSLAELAPEDVAAGAQQVLEEVVLPFVRAAVQRTGCGHVALAGGVFGNVTLNRRIADLPEVDSVWVHPAMSDQGIALGAALLAVARRNGLQPRAFETAFLGPRYDAAACEQALEQKGLAARARRPDDLPGAVADLLADGKAVARCDGAVEYGPRALGNRSILVRPDDRSVNDWLNERLDRSEFMPFAPITLAEHAAELYEVDGVEPCLPWMTVAVPVKNPADPRHEGVVHVDGTARPQVLERAANPGMYDILAAVHKRTGLPSLVNTSFNTHGEPIVCSPADAVDTFLRARLDALVLGPFLVLQPEPGSPR